MMPSFRLQRDRLPGGKIHHSTFPQRQPDLIKYWTSSISPYPHHPGKLCSRHIGIRSIFFMNSILVAWIGFLFLDCSSFLHESKKENVGVLKTDWESYFIISSFAKTT